MSELDAAPDATAQTGSGSSESNDTAIYRLVIRAEIIPDDASQIPAPTPTNNRLLALVAGMIAVLLVLTWIGVNLFSADSTATPGDGAADTASRSSVVESNESVAAASTQQPQPSPSTSAPNVAPAAANSTEVRAEQSQPAPVIESGASPVKEVIPDVPRSALQTIRGTVRVVIRVTVDQQGKVVAAASEVPGPSRYFERLAIAAAKQWTFMPTDTQAQRSVPLRFNFTRDAATAQVDPSAR